MQLILNLAQSPTKLSGWLSQPEFFSCSQNTYFIGLGEDKTSSWPMVDTHYMFLTPLGTTIIHTPSCGLQHKILCSRVNEFFSLISPFPLKWVIQVYKLLFTQPLTFFDIKSLFSWAATEPSFGERISGWGFPKFTHSYLFHTVISPWLWKGTLANGNSHQDRIKWKTDLGRIKAYWSLTPKSRWKRPWT